MSLAQRGPPPNTNGRPLPKYSSPQNVFLSLCHPFHFRDKNIPPRSFHNSSLVPYLNFENIVPSLPRCLQCIKQASCLELFPEADPELPVGALWSEGHHFFSAPSARATGSHRGKGNAYILIEWGGANNPSHLASLPSLLKAREAAYASPSSHQG